MDDTFTNDLSLSLHFEAAAAIVVSIMCIPCFMCLVLRRDRTFSTLDELRTCHFNFWGSYKLDDNDFDGNKELALLRIAQSEVKWTLLQPWIGLCFGLAVGRASTECEDSTVPAWAQGVVVLVVVMRACVADAALVRILRKNTGDNRATVCTLVVTDLAISRMSEPPEFVLSKFELADASMDGVAIAVVLLECQKPCFQARLAAAWSGSEMLERFIPSLSGIGLPCIMAFTLVMASLAQFASSFVDEKVSYSLAGFGAMSKRVASADAERVRIKMVHIVVTAVQEAAPQVILQGTALMAAGGGLEANPTLALSMISSSLFLLRKAVQLLRHSKYLLDDGDLFRALVMVCFPIALVGMLYWSTGRILMAESCTSRIWGVISGCGQVPKELEMDLFRLDILGHHLKGPLAVIVAYVLLPFAVIAFFGAPFLYILRIVGRRFINEQADDHDLSEDAEDSSSPEDDSDEEAVDPLCHCATNDDRCTTQVEVLRG